MTKFFAQSLAFLSLMLVTMVAIAWQTATDAAVNLGDADPIAVPAVIATAPAPPTLVPAILNGDPIQVLYITRSADQVLVRCYPGYEPALSVRAMGSKPDAGGQQEGLLTCVASES